MLVARLAQAHPLAKLGRYAQPEREAATWANEYVLLDKLRDAPPPLQTWADNYDPTTQAVLLIEYDSDDAMVPELVEIAVGSLATGRSCST